MNLEITWMHHTSAVHRVLLVATALGNWLSDFLLASYHQYNKYCPTISLAAEPFSRFHHEHALISLHNKIHAEVIPC